MLFAVSVRVCVSVSKWKTVRAHKEPSWKHYSQWQSGRGWSQESQTRLFRTVIKWGEQEGEREKNRVESVKVHAKMGNVLSLADNLLLVPLGHPRLLTHAHKYLCGSVCVQHHCIVPEGIKEIKLPSPLTVPICRLRWMRAMQIAPCARYSCEINKVWWEENPEKAIDGTFTWRRGI